MKRTTLRRHRQKDPVTPELAAEVFERDDFRCVARRFDAGHVCQGRLTIEHVPERGENALGKRAPSRREHLTIACLGAQQGWCLTHREQERVYLEALYPPSSAEGTDAGAVTTPA